MPRHGAAKKDEMVPRYEAKHFDTEYKPINIRICRQNSPMASRVT